ncbi:hypothetical protein TGAM01_v202204 [Trichoderma gamsii]|uniref:SRR1-like domain-containing protein n=1 Tax=Trichoderma gamsii TaxID=398673 RepID=A0A2P4ZXT7_9HYPO|nr:hypothetical protein TGAM01_v202204 [Trichoderma gamsii]PON29096.1 hypothetical protein TGAM01_v202204 [Trichoderma gamsii]
MEDAAIAEMMAEIQQNPPEEEWTLVPVRKGKGGRPKPVPDPTDVKAILSQPTMRPRSILASSSKEAIAGQHFYILRDYKESRECRVLQALINVFKAEIKGSEDPITKAICLGIGSFDPDNGSWITKERTHMQFAAFSIILDELLIFQEPAFNESDAEFITSLGHEVVESPAAFDKVDSTTFVFGIHLYRDIYAQVFKNGEYPALFVGTGWNVWSNVSFRWTAEENHSLALLKAMETTHKRFPFPETPGKNIFYGTSIYWAST